MGNTNFTAGSFDVKEIKGKFQSRSLKKKLQIQMNSPINNINL